MTEFFDDMNPEELDYLLLPKLEELEYLPDVLGDYAESEIELTTDGD